MNRLYVAESGLTLTGSMADHRLRLPSSHMLALTAKLAGAVDSGLSGALASFAGGSNVDQKWIDECVADLTAHRGASLRCDGQRVLGHVDLRRRQVLRLLAANISHQRRQACYQGGGLQHFAGDRRPRGSATGRQAREGNGSRDRRLAIRAEQWPD